MFILDGTFQRKTCITQIFLIDLRTFQVRSAASSRTSQPSANSTSWSTLGWRWTEWASPGRRGPPCCRRGRGVRSVTRDRYEDLFHNSWYNYTSPPGQTLALAGLIQYPGFLPGIPQIFHDPPPPLRLDPPSIPNLRHSLCVRSMSGQRRECVAGEPGDGRHGQQIALRPPSCDPSLFIQQKGTPLIPTSFPLAPFVCPSSSSSSAGDAASRLTRSDDLDGRQCEIMWERILRLCNACSIEWREGGRRQMPPAL